MASVPSKLYSDDVSLVMVLLDTNPFFWTTSSLPFSQFLSHVFAFLNSILLLNQLNQVVVIATGFNSCDYVYDSSSETNLSSEDGRMPALYANLLLKLEEFMIKDEKLGNEASSQGKIASSLLSGSLSMALCYIQRVFRSGPLHPQPRILCLQGSPDGPEQYVAVMNSIFSAQRSMVPIDSCYVGAHNSAFLQQASYITGGVYVKPQHLDGLFQYLVTVFATDLHSRSFLQLPRPAGQYLVNPNQIIPHQIVRERLQKHDLTLLEASLAMVLLARNMLKSKDMNFIESLDLSTDLNFGHIWSDLRLP